MSSNGTGLGDFFVKLGLISDKASFETGNKYIDGISNGLNKLMATARNTAVAVATTSAIMNKLETADLQTAAALGIQTEALDKWRAALKISGNDANAFIASMSQLDTKLKKRRIDGTFDQNLATNLAHLGLSYGEMEDMDADARTRKILEAAQAMEDQEKASIVVGEILGQAGRNFFEYMRLSNQTLDQVLSKGSGSIFTNEESKMKATEFNAEFQLLKESISQLTKLFGSEIGEGLTPFLKEINDWLQQNRSTIKRLADDLGTIAEWIGKKAAPLVEGAGKVATDVAGAAAAAIDGDFDTANEKMTAAGRNAVTAVQSAITGEDEEEIEDKYYDRLELINILAKMWGEKYGDHPHLNAFKKLKYEELPEDVQASIDKHGGKKEWKAYVNDGIIRPNGQITHVAPDDWVFAARNVGDLAAAFMPQAGANTAGPVQITISQNFTVNGTNDIPQLIKQQAYNGTRDGLTEMLSKAGTRLQLMPGLA